MKMIFKNAAGLDEVVDAQQFTANGSKYYSFRAADGRSRTINESNPCVSKLPLLCALGGMGILTHPSKRMIDLAQTPVKENV